jgi:hypothetical protein
LVPVTDAKKDVAEFAWEVPFGTLPCQYQMLPSAGLTRVRVFASHVLVDTVGTEGADGITFTETATEVEAGLQQPKVFRALRKYVPLRGAE